jgi:hypothetical protein
VKKHPKVLAAYLGSEEEGAAESRRLESKEEKSSEPRGTELS